MKRAGIGMKYVPDKMVVLAAMTKERNQFTLDQLVRISGQPEKVCFRAIERAIDRGYCDCGISTRTAWATDEGKALLP